MAPHSSTLAWKIPWTEEPGRLQSMGSLRVGHEDTTERLHCHFSLSCIGEGNGNPLQCSCLENPSDGGAWWAAICGVAQSRTRMKQLSSSSSSIVTYDRNLSLKFYRIFCTHLDSISVCWINLYKNTLFFLKIIKDFMYISLNSYYFLPSSNGIFLTFLK